MIYQPQLQDIRLGTLPAIFDMCQVGRLHLPSSKDFHQKRTQVFTTSRKLFERVHEQFCNGNHQHNPIKGKFRRKGDMEIGFSVRTSLHSTVCTTCGQGILGECKEPERPLLEEEMIFWLEEKEIHERPELAQECCSCKSGVELH